MRILCPEERSRREALDTRSPPAIAYPPALSVTRLRREAQAVNGQDASDVRARVAQERACQFRMSGGLVRSHGSPAGPACPVSHCRH